MRNFIYWTQKLSGEIYLAKSKTNFDILPMNEISDWTVDNLSSDLRKHQNYLGLQYLYFHVFSTHDPQQMIIKILVPFQERSSFVLGNNLK